MRMISKPLPDFAKCAAENLHGIDHSFMETVDGFEAYSETFIVVRGK